jgi:hypothetical protein
MLEGYRLGPQGPSNSLYPLTREILELILDSHKFRRENE